MHALMLTIVHCSRFSCVYPTACDIEQSECLMDVHSNIIGSAVMIGRLVSCYNSFCCGRAPKTSGQCLPAGCIIDRPSITTQQITNNG